jgi:hypothetical protein
VGVRAGILAENGDNSVSETSFQIKKNLNDQQFPEIDYYNNETLVGVSRKCMKMLKLIKHYARNDV